VKGKARPLGHAGVCLAQERLDGGGATSAHHIVDVLALGQRDDDGAQAAASQLIAQARGAVAPGLVAVERDIKLAHLLAAQKLAVRIRPAGDAPGRQEVGEAHIPERHRVQDPLGDHELLAGPRRLRHHQPPPWAREI
jgi:hypothetical protein